MQVGHQETDRRPKKELNTGRLKAARQQKRKKQMEQLTQTISNIVGIMMGLVGAVGVGFFIFGAYLYLTASGAPNQMERGKSAMMTALAGIVLAMVAYGVVELVMNSVVSPVVDVELPNPATPVPTKTG